MAAVKMSLKIIELPLHLIRLSSTPSLKGLTMLWMAKAGWFDFKFNLQWFLSIKIRDETWPCQPVGWCIELYPLSSFLWKLTWPGLLDLAMESLFWQCTERLCNAQFALAMLFWIFNSFPSSWFFLPIQPLLGLNHKIK